MLRLRLRAVIFDDNLSQKDHKKTMTTPVFLRFRSFIRSFVGALVALAFFSACTALFNTPVEIPTGEYRGDYSITNADPADTLFAFGKSNEISLTINAAAQTYSVIPHKDSSIVVSSQGVYALELRRITFTDRTRAAFADTALVLRGEWSYTFDGTNLILKKTENRQERTMVLLRRF
jgi:hypothetical protein